MDEKEQLEDDIINLKGEVVILRAYVKALSLIMVSVLKKTYGFSNKEAYDFFQEILNERISAETNALLDSTSLDDEIRSLLEDD